MNVYKENSPEEPEKKEIRLDYLMLYLIRKRKIVMLTALLLALVMILTTVYQIMAVMCSETRMASYEYYYSNALSAYESSLKTLEEEIALINDNLEKQQLYNADSILMNTDPYYKEIFSLEYYIDTNYLIIPENTYQDINYSSRLLKYYLSYLNSGEMYELLMAELPEVKDVRYISEIFEASADYTANTITVSVICDNDDTATKMLDVIRTVMKEMYSQAETVIAEHELTEVGNSQEIVTDLTLAEQQQENMDMVSEYSVLLEEKNETWLELKQSDDIPKYQYATTQIVLNIVKAGVFGGVGGWLLAMLGLTMFYAFSDTALDVDKLQMRTRLRIIGCINCRTQKWPKKWIGAVASVFGYENTETSFESSIKLMALNLLTMAEASGIREGKIALIGSIGEDELEELTNALNGELSDDVIRFEAAGNPLSEADSVAKIKQAAVVALTAKQEYSQCTEIQNEYRQILNWGKEPIGVIFLDVHLL